MNYIADLHIHSRFARACSDKINVQNLEKWAKIKGINVLGTGDFTHPEWLEELKKKLTEDGNGILRTENGFPFILQVEISQIYSQGGEGRRIHNLILAPDFNTVDKIREYFSKHGRLDHDGRPTFGMTCEELVKYMKKINERIEIIPAHVWTPWYSLFGSKSGFDTVKEAFGKQAKHIHALETGLSSDPEMNRRVSGNDNYNLVSFSDAHSFWPWRLGREATIFDLEELTYDNVIKAIRTGEGIAETIEVPPSHGKYHIDGHRKCNVVMEPKEALDNNNICPECGKPLTLGVLHRVEELADRDAKDIPKFRHLLTLSEILSTMLDSGINTKTVWKPYNALIEEFKTEYNVLLHTSREDLEGVIHPKIAGAIILNRKGKIKVKPGYDGVYGETELKKVSGSGLKEDASQKGLGEF